MSGGPSTMVVHIAKRGRDMPGLLRYLYGPGKENQHTDQRMVAGSAGLTMAFPGQLTPGEATMLGQAVQLSWRTQMSEQLAVAGVGQGGISSAVLTAGSHPGAVTESEKEHVYHLIASLPPGNIWDDEQWATVAGDMVSGMGFTSGPDDDQGCRWTAIRHGLSGNGNDHLHIAVNLVRRDGHRARLPSNDFRLAQEVRQRVELQRPFVLPLHDAGRRPGGSLPGYTMAEHQQSKRRAEVTGQEVPDRVMLQHAVRAAALSARTEVEWMHAVLDAHQDVQLEAARWAPGGRDTVTGYKVRLGEGPWFSASVLAPDLTLQKLRPRWQGNETADTRSQAGALWREEQPPDVLPVREWVEPILQDAEREMRAWNEHLTSADPQERAVWAAAVGDTAGIVSAMARTAGPVGEQLAVAGNTLARQTLNLVADNHGAQPLFPVPAVTYGPSPAQTAARHVQLALRASSVDQHHGWAAVLQQLRQVVDAIEAAQRARRELVAAQQTRDGVSAVLQDVSRTVAGGGADDPDVAAVLRHQQLTNMGRGTAGAAGGVSDVGQSASDRDEGLHYGREQGR